MNKSSVHTAPLLLLGSHHDTELSVVELPIRVGVEGAECLFNLQPGVMKPKVSSNVRAVFVFTLYLPLFFLFVMLCIAFRNDKCYSLLDKSIFIIFVIISINIELINISYVRLYCKNWNIQL